MNLGQLRKAEEYRLAGIKGKTRRDNQVFRESLRVVYRTMEQGHLRCLGPVMRREDNKYTTQKKW